MQQRRRMISRRHHLGGDAETPEQAVRAVLALHASDPASVYLSILARSARTTLADVAEAMYRRRTLVRWMAIRRTLFLLPRDDVPVVQAAVSTPLAATLRRKLVARLERNGTRPPVRGDLEQWLHDLEERVEEAISGRGTATGAQLSFDVPALRTVIPPKAPSDRPQTLTSPLLTMMGAEGRLVRGSPTGSWTSRHHRWEPVEHWWPAGMAVPSIDEARQVLAHQYFARFGPATIDDFQWWTGWTKTTVRRALVHLPAEEVDLNGESGLVLPDDNPDNDPEAPAATLLPALDPTSMGWKQREWMLGINRHHLFDRAGNIGPTLWWDGEVIGSWTVRPTGDIRTAVLADRGAEADEAIHDAAARMHQRLNGATFTPAVRTPLEQSLRL